jgi:hypothetical protein
MSKEKFDIEKFHKGKRKRRFVVELESEVDSIYDKFDRYGFARYFFERGREHYKPIFINKACKWLENISLEDMVYKYKDFDTSEDWYKFINDFRKAMEEQL